MQINVHFYMPVGMSRKRLASWPDFFHESGKIFYMDNRKLVAGILTAVAAGIAVSLVLNTKKGRATGSKLLKKGSSLTEDLKGKFNEFIDRVEGRVQGILK
jgi:hypothetical protein